MKLGVMTVMMTLLSVSAQPDAAIVSSLDHDNDLLKPGYPGYKAPRFSLAPRLPEPRSLFYRKTPGVEKLQSPVHELYMRPYNYANLAHSAVAVVQSDAGVSGIVSFHQKSGPTAPVKITGTLKGLSPGHHGFHISVWRHEWRMQVHEGTFQSSRVESWCSRR